MAWYDPAGPSDPNASYLTQNPAIRDALLMFGANMLANARKPGMQGIGESIGAGFNTWAQRRAQYDKEMREKQILADLAAGRKSPIGAPLPNSTDPNFRRAYDDPSYQPTGATTTIGNSPQVLPQPAAPLSDSGIPGGYGGYPGGIPSRDYRLSGAQGFTPTPDYSFGGPYAGHGPGRSPSLPAPIAAPIAVPPEAPIAPYGVPGPITQAPAPGLFNLASAGGGGPGSPFGGTAGSDIRLGGADRDVLAPPVDLAVARAGLTSQQADVFRSMVQAESAGHHRTAEGEITTSRAGARGLAQVMPGTFAEMKRKYGIEGSVDDEEANAEAGARYFKEMLDRYGGDVEKAVMAYNAGPGNIDKGIIPDETSKYRVAVLGGGSRQVASAQGQAVMAGGAEQDTAQPLPPTLDSLAPDWKRQGLLEQAREGEGLYTASGEFNEDAKRTLRYALEAGGTEGFQQALMTLVQQKPDTFGTAETGIFSRNPWTGRVTQVSAPTGKDVWDDITEQVPYKVGPGVRIMHNRKTGNTEVRNVDPQGQTINIDTKAPATWFESDQKQSAGWTDSGRKIANTVGAMQPTTEWLKAAATEGRSVTGWGSSQTLSLRRAAQDFGLPFGENVTEQELLGGLRARLMADLHEPGMGSSSDWESRAFVDAGPSLDKSTEGNYLLVKGLEAQANRKLWLGKQSRDYMDTVDPATGKPRNSLKGFDDWLNTPDAQGHRPIDDMPHMMKDASKMTAEQIKGTQPGDVLFVDGQIKVRPKEIPDGSTMSEAQARNLKSGSLVILNGQLRIIP